MQQKIYLNVASLIASHLYVKNQYLYTLFLIVVKGCN